MINSVIHSYCLQYEIPENSTVLLGVSGGVDSMVLVHVLSRLGYFSRIIGCYINHKIREPLEITKDIDCISGFLSQLGIPFMVISYPGNSIIEDARTKRKSIEEFAREFRYQALEQLRLESEIDYIALAHHQDDQRETLLMRVLNGSGIQGLQGIPPVRKPFIRPFYSLDKIDIVKYAKDNSIPFVPDSTNEDVSIPRNSLRNEIIPLLKKRFPGMNTGLDNFSRTIGETRELVDYACQRFVHWEPIGSGYRMPVEDFASLPVILRKETLFRLFDHINTGETLPVRFLNPVLSIDSVMSDRVLLKGYGFILYLRENYIFWDLDIVDTVKKRYLMIGRFGTSRTIGKWKFVVDQAIDEAGGSESPGNNILRIPVVTIHEPVIIRSRFEGDTIRVTYGVTSIKKLFNSWNVPFNLREQIPVIEDRNGIVAVFGKPFGFQNVVRYNSFDTADPVGDHMDIQLTFLESNCE